MVLVGNRTDHPMHFVPLIELLTRNLNLQKKIMKVQCQLYIFAPIYFHYINSTANMGLVLVICSKLSSCFIDMLKHMC